jgi:protein unc-80
VALSGLLDSAQLLLKKDGQHSPSALRKPHEDHTGGHSSPTQMDESDRASHKKLFFKKKTSSSGIKQAPSNQSLHEECSTDWPLSANQALSSNLRVHKPFSPRLSITDDDVMFIQKGSKSGKDSKGFNLANWFKQGSKQDQSQSLNPENVVLLDNGASTSFTSNSEPTSDKLSRKSSFTKKQLKAGLVQAMNQSSQQKHMTTFNKARKRMEDQFKFVFGKSKAKHGSFEETPDMPRKYSFDFDHTSDGDMILIRESKLVSLPAVKDGMIRFQFLLESCTPGTLPDPPLIAAMLDIRAPVVARAAFYLECAYFVHRCNRGYWPSWMRLNFNLFRPSGNFLMHLLSDMYLLKYYLNLF